MKYYPGIWVMIFIKHKEVSLVNNQYNGNEGRIFFFEDFECSDSDGEKKWGLLVANL